MIGMYLSSIHVMDASEFFQHLVHKNVWGFRNFHENDKIDIEILKSITKFHLQDIEEFYSVVLRHYHIAD